MTLDIYEGHPYGSEVEVYDITDVNFEDVLAFFTENYRNPSEYIVEYAYCGSHTVILRRLSREELV